MGKTLKYVKEFDFNAKPCEYSRGGAVKAPDFAPAMVKSSGTLGVEGNKNPGIKGSKPVAPNLAPQKLAKGGPVREKATGEVYPSRMAMEKHEMSETPREQRAEVIKKAAIKGMAPRRMVPVAPAAPLLGMKKGGAAVPKAGAYKVPKVMGEFKKGELHSGSKSGPVVTNRKQATAIALSEARAAGKK